MHWAGTEVIQTCENPTMKGTNPTIKPFFGVKALITITLSLQLFVAAAQPVPMFFEKLITQPPLPENAILCLFQDSRGFLWIGTGGGLIKYDGYNTTHFRSLADRPDALAGNSVFDMAEDTLNGRPVLWVGCKGGLSRIDMLSGRVFTYPHTGFLPDNNIYSLLNHGNSLWIGTGAGLSQYDTRNNTIRHFPDLPVRDANSGRQIHSICKDPQTNHLWLGASNLYRFDMASKTWRSWSALGVNTSVVKVVADKRGTIRAVCKQGIMQYNRENDTVRMIPFDERLHLGAAFVANDMIQFDDDLLIGGKGEIVWYSPVQNMWTKIAFVPNAGTASFSDNLNTLLVDKTGVLWIGSFSSGLYRTLLRRKNFRNYPQPFSDTHGDTKVNVYSIYIDSHHRIWLGTFNHGVCVLNRNTPQIAWLSDNLPDNDALKGQPVTCIHIDRKNTLWIGGMKQGLYALDLNKHPLNERMLLPRGATFRVYEPRAGDNRAISGWAARCIFEDQSGRIWIGQRDKGLCYFDYNTQGFNNFGLPQNDRSVAGDPGIWYITQRPSETDRRLWIATVANGLACFNIESKTFTYYTQNNGLGNNNVRFIYQPDDSSMWISMGETGLQYIRVTDHGISPGKIYTEADGLPNNMIYAILPDTRGNLWLSTERGISCFSPKTETFRNYNMNDGLPHDKFNFGALATDPSTGEFFLGGINGITSFSPDSIRDDSIAPIPYFTVFRLFNREINPGDTINGRILLHNTLAHTREIVLKKSENDFTVEFVALHLANPEENHYEYVLEGYDKSWRQTDAQARFATYTNLPAGKYTLRLRVANSDNVWCKQPARLTITILPAWWETYWAYSVYLLVIMLLMALTRWVLLLKIKFRHRLEIERINAEKDRMELRQKHELTRKEREIDQMKLRFFMNISHEFRTPLTLILGPADSLLKNTTFDTAVRNNLLLISRNTKRLLRLVNQLLDLRKLETESMRLNLMQGNLVGFLQAIYESFHYLAKRHSIDYELIVIETPAEIPAYFDPDKVEKIMYNLISNAFKYTPDHGKITVELKVQNDQWAIAVSDNGTGIPADKQPYIFDRFYQAAESPRKQSGTGIGLALTKELVQLHQGTIAVESSEGRGSRFTVHLPLQYPEGQEIALQTIPSDLTTEYPSKTEFEKYPHITNTGNVYDDDIFKPILPDDEEYEQEESSDKQKPVVLLVDDNPDILVFIAGELNRKYKFLTATNGQEALRLANKSIPDLIVSDVRMPEMDGITLCNRLKADSFTCHIPVILLTAQTSDDNQIEGLRTGANDYITKPFNIEILEQKIENTLHNVLRIQEKYRRMFSAGNVADVQMPLAADERFMQQAMAIIRQHFGDEDFNVDTFAEKMQMNRMQLHRKLKALTGEPAGDFIRNIRLEKAAEMLKTGKYTVAEVAYSTGFKSPTHFSQCFSKRYEVSPSQYK